MTALVAAGLLALALLDGSCSGFRSSAGRTGLINHREADHQAARRGAGLACVLLAPAITLASVDVLLHPDRIKAYKSAGEAMLAIYAPYAAVALAALACYTTLRWRQRYLACAVILGPLTLLRPGVAILGAALAATVSHDTNVATCAGLSVTAVLAVEPLAGHRWYVHQPRS
jgi:hypothetical protein